MLCSAFILASTISVTSGSPTRKELKRRQDPRYPGVYMCAGTNWAPPCVHQPPTTNPPDIYDGYCVSIDTKTLGARPLSVGPDPEWTCKFFSNAFCRDFGSSIENSAGTVLGDLIYPGTPDVHDVGWPYGPASYYCNQY